MSEPGSLLAPELPQELIELRRQFVSRLPGRIDEIAELFHALSDGRWEAGSGETLHRMVHSLSGTAGTFGMHDISRAARRLETRLASLIEGADAPSDVAWRTLSTDMALLHELGAAQRPARQTEAVAAPVQPARSTTLIHLVIDDAATAERLRLELLRNDFHAEVFDSPQAFHRASLLPDTRRPGAVVMDITGPDSAAGLPGLIQQLGLADNPDIPLLVGLSEGDLTTRIAVNRAGARHSLPQPLDPERLVDALNSLTGGAPERPWRVLLVDDEPLVLQAHAVYLKQAGMDVRTLTDPMQTLEEVQRFEPDVLVIDVYMPEVNGPEIAAALRESDVCPQLAIIFLSAETDMTQQLVALDLGGDDFLIKPVQPRHLVAPARGGRNGTTHRRFPAPLAATHAQRPPQLRHCGHRLHRRATPLSLPGRATGQSLQEGLVHPHSPPRSRPLAHPCVQRGKTLSLRPARPPTKAAKAQASPRPPSQPSAPTAQTAHPPRHRPLRRKASKPDASAIRGVSDCEPKDPGGADLPLRQQVSKPGPQPRRARPAHNTAPPKCPSRGGAPARSPPRHRHPAASPAPTTNSHGAA